MQEAFAERRRWLWEAAVRRKTLKAPGWDSAWSEDERKRRGEETLKTNTICEIRNYKPPEAFPPLVFPSLDTLLKDESPYPPPRDDWDVHQAMARLEIVRVDPSRGDRLFPPDFYLNEYWLKLVQHSLDHLDLLWDTADFGANHLLRVLYLYGETPKHFGDPPWRQASKTPPYSQAVRERQEITLTSEEIEERKQLRLRRNRYFSARVEERIKQSLLGFKYWIDDPFWPEPVLDHALPWSGIPVVPGLVSIPTAAGVSNNALVDKRKAKDIEKKRQEKAKAKDIEELENTNPYRDDKWWYDMTYWSENHQILFATAEYLAGQMWPGETFRAGAQHRDLGPDSPRDGDKNGEARMAHARPRLLRWLNDRLRFGFSEWNSAVYYKEDFDALFNLADFCQDDEIRTRAAMVIDLMIFDLARFTHAGNFGSSSGRMYSDQKQCGWEQSIAGMLQLLFGARGTVWMGADSCESALASSRRYEVPDALLAIGRDQPDVFVDRSRVSVTFDEAPEYGVGTSSDDDVMFWWGRGAFVNTQIVEASRRVCEQYKLMHTNIFKAAFLPAAIGGALVSGAGLLAYALAATRAPLALTAVIPLVGDPFAGEKEGADLLSVAIEGSTLSRANLYCYRNHHAMLASVQNFRPGQLNFQSHFCQATLSPDATVWTTHPSGGLGIDEGWVRIAGGAAAFAAGGPIGLVVEEILADDVHLLPPSGDGPSWWTGSVTVPRVVQMRNAAIIAYKPQGLQWLLSGGRTHAWFPRPAFDQGDEWSFTALPAFDCNVDTGRWIFGRVGNGYVGLYSAQRPKWTSKGDWTDKELVADGDRNIFILQIGSDEEYGTYETFMDRVQHARIHINGLNWKLSDFQCSYDIPRTKRDEAARGPGSDRLELHYDKDGDAVRYNGQPFDDSRLPRFENRYVRGGRVLWGQYDYTIECDGHRLTHDFRELADKDIDTARVHRHLDGRSHANALLERINATAQRQIAGVGSTDGPALAVAGQLQFTDAPQWVYMAWKGTEDDAGLYWSRFDGTDWAAQVKIEGIGSSHGPALAAYPLRDGFDTGLAMAWKGVAGDSGLYFSLNPTRATDGWYPQENVPNVGSSARPALALFEGEFWLAWKGIEGDSGLYFARRVDDRWTPQMKIPGVGSKRGPSLVVAGGRLWLFWKGVDDDANVRIASLRPGSQTEWEDAEVIACRAANGSKTTKIGSSHPPTPVPVGDAILMLWKGVPDDSAIYLSAREDSQWGGQVKWKGVGTSRAPGAAVLGGRVIVAWKGTEDDHGLYYATLTMAPDANASGIWFEWQA